MNVRHLWSKRRPSHPTQNGLGQVIRRARTQRLIDIRQMLAIKLVKLPIVGRVMLRPVPPVPIAAFRNQDLFKSQLALRFTRLRPRLCIKIPRMVKVVPRPVVLRRPNPNIEISVDPRSRNNLVEHIEFSMPLDGFRNGHRLHPWLPLKSVIKTPQKFASRFRVVLPRIFSIQNDRHHRILARIQ